MPRAKATKSEGSEESQPRPERQLTGPRWVEVRDANGMVVPLDPNTHVRSLARIFTADAIKTLVDIARDTHCKSPAARVAAAAILLERGWGKAVQPIVTATSLDDETLRAQAALILARRLGLNPPQSGIGLGSIPLAASPPLSSPAPLPPLSPPTTPGGMDSGLEEIKILRAPTQDGDQLETKSIEYNPGVIPPEGKKP